MKTEINDSIKKYNKNTNLKQIIIIKTENYLSQILKI